MERYTLKDLWIKACEFDGIAPNSKFVVWSKENHWARKYNTLLFLRTRMHRRQAEQQIDQEEKH